MLEKNPLNTSEILTANIIEMPEGFNLFSEKFNKSAANQPCTVCGRETSNKGNASGVVVVKGGGSLIAPSDVSEAYIKTDAGYMGWFPVGAECIKKVPAQYRAKDPM